MIKSTKPVIVSTRQRLVLQRLAKGWNLDRSGRDGLGGIMFRDKRNPTIRVSVADMNALYSWAIWWDASCDLWFLTDAGRQYVESQ